MHVLMWGFGQLSAGRAVKRLRRMSGGGEIALIGSFRGTSSAAPLLSLDKARSWLSRIEGVGLLVHDDVTFDQADLEAIRQAHLRSEALTTATLDPYDLAGARDVPLVLGSTEMLAGFIEDIRVGRASSATIEQLEGVKVDHTRGCAETKAPLLVASMIVRDEADQIGDCLDSLTGVVDRIEIVDTGSEDDTVEIATNRGANVSTAEWADDFATARNSALERCRDARFVLHVDADERLVVPDPEGFRAELESSDARAMRIRMRNLVDHQVTSEFEAVRLFSPDRTAWVGKVHEYPADLDGTPLPAGRIEGMAIDHLGYDPKIVAAKNKWDRNVSLAEAAYLSDPSFKTRLDLARSLAWRSDEERAFELFREAAADLTGASDGAAAFVIAHVALSCQIEGDLDQAHGLADRAIGFCSGEFVAHLAKARAWRVTGDDRAIVKAHTQRSASTLDEPMFDTSATRTMTDTLTIGALARLGRHVDALELAVPVLEADPARFDEWKSLASMPPALRETGLPLLASIDRAGGFVDALVGEIPMSELAAVVLAHVRSGEARSHAVITGIMAAILANDAATAAAIAECGVTALDDDERVATAERCRLRDAQTVAAILDPAAVTR